jgi:hypothetical protein
MLASNQSRGCNASQVAKALGVDRCNIKKAMPKRRFQLNTKKDVFWIGQRQTRRSNSLLQTFKELVIQWWTNEPTISHVEDIVRQCIGIKLDEKHSCHYLQSFAGAFQFKNFMFIPLAIM